MSTPTPREVVRILPALLRRIPVAVRGWLYLALVAVAVAFIIVTAWRDGLSSDQLVALFVAAAGALAKANTSA